MSQSPSSRPEQPGAGAASQEATVHHVPRRKKKAGPSSGSMQLNLTSMIDVTFLLLIYFIVTASFMLDEGVLTARMPQGTGQKTEESLEPPPEKVEIQLTDRGNVGVAIQVGTASHISDFTELAKQLQSMQLNKQNTSGWIKPDNPIIIKPRGKVRWQHVVNAFNAAVKARYTNVAFAQASGNTPESP